MCPLRMPSRGSFAVPSKRGARRASSNKVSALVYPREHLLSINKVACSWLRRESYLGLAAHSSLVAPVTRHLRQAVRPARNTGVIKAKGFEHPPRACSAKQSLIIINNNFGVDIDASNAHFMLELLGAA